MNSPVSDRVRYLSLIGPSLHTCTPEIYAFGQLLGRRLVDAGYGIACGGLFGFMEAVCKGAKASEATFRGATIGIIPGENRSEANPYCDIVIPTGIGFSRNVLVVRSGEAVIAVGGGAGTVSEIAYAWQFGKPICGITGFGGWSEEFAGKVIDNRYSTPIATAASPEEVLQWLSSVFPTEGK